MKPCILALTALLSACSGGETRLMVREQAAMGQIGFAGPVLAQARRDFLGGSAGGFLGGVTDQVAVDHSGGAALAGAVAVVRTDAVTPGLTLRSTLFVEHAKVSTRLPDGLGVFTDPMQVDIWATALGAEVSVGHAIALPGGRHADVAAGFGLTRVAARVHLQSALIDRRSKALVTLPYLALSGQYWPLYGPNMVADVRFYDPDTAEVRLGLVQRW